VLLKRFKYNCLFVGIILLPLDTLAQGKGREIVNISFGEDKANPGPPLPPNNTRLTYSKDSCALPPGSYTVTNNLYRCPATRMGRSIDHTPGSNYGYMMLVNDTPSTKSKIVFIDTLHDVLCEGTQYEFSAYLLNTGLPADCNPLYIHYPRFTFKVETITGQLIQSANTGLMPYDYDPDFTPKFHLFSLDFYPPPGLNGFVLKIEDDPSIVPCKYSFALDDIKLTSLGPDVPITFDHAIGIVLVKNVCYQAKETISMNGSVPAFYPNTVVEWQQSTDHGAIWADIPGATSDSFSNVFSTPGTFLFRLSAGDVSNFANQNCRVVSNVLRVEVEGPPTDYTVTSNSPVCTGSQLQFDATGGASYEWTGPNGFYDNVYYAHIFRASLSDSGTYYVDIISVGGCRARDSIHVTILGTVDVHAFPDTSICKGSAVRLGTTPGTSYSWAPGDGLSGTTISNPIAKPGVSTLYVVTVTDSTGCSDTAHVQINILNSVAAKAGIAGSDILCRPVDSASFKNLSTGNIVKWSWSFGNGHADFTADPPVQTYSIPDNEDSYVVSLAVADSTGCTDTAYHLIKVVKNCYIAVPSAFTPNGDGLNDYLYPLNAYKATNLLFRVYNRNGELIFETRDWTRKWDGTLRGMPQASGVYVWMLEYNDASGKKVSLKGTSALIR